jgi:hypothetical protein
MVSWQRSDAKFMTTNDAFSQACGVFFGQTQKKRKRPGAPSNDEEFPEDSFEDFPSESEDEYEPCIRTIKRIKIGPKANDNRIQIVPKAFKNIRVPKHPDPTNLRTWHSRCGNYEVSAEYLGLLGSETAVALHKSNGVRIKVPIVKFSLLDIDYVASLHGYILGSDALSSTEQTIPIKREVFEEQQSS